MDAYTPRLQPDNFFLRHAQVRYQERLSGNGKAMYYCLSQAKHTVSSLQYYLSVQWRLFRGDGTKWLKSKATFRNLVPKGGLEPPRRFHH